MGIRSGPPRNQPDPPKRPRKEVRWTKRWKFDPGNMTSYSIICAVDKKAFKKWIKKHDAELTAKIKGIFGKQRPK